MKSFELVRTKTKEDVLKAIAEHAEDGKIIAGGVALLITLKQRVAHFPYLIDVSPLNDLRYIRVNGEEVSIGALTTHREIELDKGVAENFPLLHDVFRHVGTIRIRTQGTIGGNLCFAEPAADPPAALMALEAVLKVEKQGSLREVPVDRFFVDYYETAVEPDEFLTEIRVPKPPAGWLSGYTKFTTRSKEDKPALSIAAVFGTEDDGKTCSGIRLSVGAAIPCPRRMHEAEDFLVGKDCTDERVLSQAGEIAKGNVEPISDIRGTAEYKRDMVEVFIRRTIQKALSSRTNGNL